MALNRKADAREAVVRLLQDVDWGRSDIAVRINSPDSGNLWIQRKRQHNADCSMFESQTSLMFLSCSHPKA